MSEHFKNLWSWVIDRLNEPSSYHAIGLAVAAVAFLTHKATFDEAVVLSASVSSFVLFITKELKAKTDLPTAIADALAKKDQAE